jgi:hypothetical protein
LSAEYSAIIFCRILVVGRHKNIRCLGSHQLMSLVLSVDKTAYLGRLIRTDSSGRCDWDNCNGKMFEWDDGTTVIAPGPFFDRGPYYNEGTNRTTWKCTIMATWLSGVV